ncbi:MAG: hypothetical protein J2O48_12810, partial [Solirubrobacterales bacterium]|nr:hypothetical protein [Solirubrobacterales bacterium]
MFRKGIAPALIAALAIALLAGCASTTTTTVNAQAPQAPQAKPKSKNASVTGVIALHGKPQVVDPVAGGSPGGSGSGGSADSGPGGGSGGSDGGGYTPAADGSGNAGGTGNGSSGSGPHKGPGWVSVTPSPGQKLAKPDSNADIEKELSASGINPNPDRATLTKQGLAIPPANAPPQVVAAIQAGNEIAHLPYVWGGGHGKYVDTGYDCSGSLSFMFGAAGILNTTMTSGDLMSWG